MVVVVVLVVGCREDAVLGGKRGWEGVTVERVVITKPSLNR